ncbi:MAG: nitroreductase family protein [Actinomycetales bacterium]|nr:nitroreductase family protein [Actinomycetales bacterium]
MSELRPAAAALQARRSRPRLGPEAPDDATIVELLETAGTVADHGAHRPWRVIALRGAARERLGEALVAATTLTGEDAARLAAKPLRAPLLLAVVAAPEFDVKVADWEQEAAAVGVAHALSLLLDEAGWGVIWRTGAQVRSEPVARMHGLAGTERLLGWLYVGAKLDDERPPRPPVGAAERFSVLEG